MPDHRLAPTHWNPRGEAEGTGPRGLPVRVWGGIPGEEGSIKVVHVGEHSTAARWRGAQEPHPHRRDPMCEKWTACGGCSLMHVTRMGQELARRDLVARAFAAEGVAAEIGQFHESPDGERNYRHVVKLGVEFSDTGRLRVGAWGRGDRRIVPIPHCNVAAPVLRKTMASIAHWIIELAIWPWDPNTGQGALRAVVLRASRTTGEVLITLVAGKHTKAMGELAERVHEGVAEVAGVWIHLNDEPGNAIFTRDGDGVVGVSPLSGRDHIEEKLNGITYRIGPGDFFQTNPGMAEVLYRRTVERMAPGPDDAVVDLYSGVGGIALQVGTQAGFVVGVEEVEGAVNRAREVSRLNKCNAEFQLGQVIDVLPELGRRLARTHPIVSVNPARRGLEPGVADAIAALAPSRIAYVSCNPRALARDIARFQTHGFHLDGPIELFDMFPHTPHVEVLALLAGPAAEASAGRAPRRKVIRAV
ncbi:MAG: 23S rRNA (uracil(1939)-C(5))-methyltransferase RlmD [Deltaproteobacteria bacterium]|nr:23S rRNA (uracil(1939)-C(5))-methyltransferase RlmD [Deltaproteobacteria bacterium]